MPHAKSILLALTLLLSTLIIAPTAHAQLCDDGVSIDTAIGCIPVEDTNATIAFLLTWGSGIAGGIALILIIYASYMIIMSSGDPKKLQAGKELLVAGIAGLLFLVFGVFALRTIGVGVLGIPGL